MIYIIIIYIYIYILISYLHIHILPWNTIYKGQVLTAILLDSALHQAKNRRDFGSLIQGTWDSRSQEPATVARWTHRVTTGSMPCCRCSCWCRGSSCKKWQRGRLWLLWNLGYSIYHHSLIGYFGRLFQAPVLFQQSIFKNNHPLSGLKKHHKFLFIKIL